MGIAPPYSSCFIKTVLQARVSWISVSDLCECFHEAPCDVGNICLDKQRAGIVKTPRLPFHLILSLREKRVGGGRDRQQNQVLLTKRSKRPHSGFGSSNISAVSSGCKFPGDTPSFVPGGASYSISSARHPCMSLLSPGLNNHVSAVFKNIVVPENNSWGK